MCSSVEPRAAQEQARELEHELAEVCRSVYSMGGNPARGERVERADVDLTGKVHARALSMQDAAGTVTKSLLVVHFREHGHRSDEIEAAIVELCSAGKARDLGARLEIL